MIIKKLLFQNFKSFGNSAENQNLSNLDIVTLIYGENNSGKSNILKFIELLFKRKLEIAATITVSGQTVTRQGEETSFWKGKIVGDAYLFHKNDRSKNILFDVTVGFSSNEISLINNSDIIKKEYGDKNYFDLVFKGRIESLVDPYEAQIILDSAYLNGKEIYLLDRVIPRYFNSSEAGLKGDSTTFENLMGLMDDCVVFLDHNRFLGTEKENDVSGKLQPSNFKNWLHNMSLDQIKYSLYEKFISFVRENSVSGDSLSVLKDFEPTFDRKEGEIDVFLKTNNERLPIHSFGTGIMQILLILAMISETSSKIILIEEIELNLSPKTQQNLLRVLTKLIEDKKCNQLIFTSHSGVFEDSKSFSIYEVQMQPNGVSRATFLEHPEGNFYETEKKVWEEMASAVRIYGVKGPEWE